MKELVYKIRGYISVYNSETEEIELKECLAEVDMPYSEANEEIVKRKAYNGKYTIEDDGIEEIPTPTELDKLDARLTYVEMMTGILEE